jgi:hypothetical protein
MAEIEVTLKMVEDLDIKASRLVGIANDPFYEELSKVYRLDAMQCLLWLDMVHVLNSLMDECDYQDACFSQEDLGARVRKIVKGQKDKFPVLCEVLEENSFLDDDLQLSNLVQKMAEDIYLVYDGIQDDLKNILASQEEIDKMVDKGRGKK